MPRAGRVLAVRRAQLVVSPALGDLPVAQHHDHVGAADRAQTVR
jgi:hypothetical protein